MQAVWVLYDHTGEIQAWGGPMSTGETSQSRHADERAALRVYNPATQSLLDDLRAATAALRSAFGAGQVHSADALGVAAQVNEIGEQVRGLHYTAVGIADEAGLWGIAGYTSTNAWLRHTHLLGSRAANRVSRTARWLTNQPDVTAALTTGDISDAHAQAMRLVATSTPARAKAFTEVAAEFVEVARNTDAEHLTRIMRSWADAVDEQASNNDARRSHEKRGLFLSPVADGWDLQGWLSAADGAELAGVLNERMQQTRRDNPDISLSAAQRRADALLDLVRTASGSGYTPAQRERAKVLVLLPLDRLTSCPTCRCTLTQDLLNTHKGSRNGNGTASGGSTVSGAWTPEARGGEPPDTAAGQWRTGNGTGRGHLAMTDAQRLACDGAIQRVVLSAESTVLDVGRTQRLVTPAIRTALEVRDGGCVIPGCDRPPGWCEAHHIKHWSAGGETSLSNLALTCSRHHHEIHHGTWHLRVDGDGQVQVSQTTRRPTPLRR